MLDDVSTPVSQPIACTSDSSLPILHGRLGHPPLPILKRVCPNVGSVSHLECEACQFGKHHRVSYSPRINKRVIIPFDVIHSDVWGPCSMLSKFGYRYFVIFVDDFLRVTWLYFMKNRSELFSIFCTFYVEIQNQFTSSIRCVDQNGS